MNNFFENFYETLFCPNKAFDRLKELKPVAQAFLIVIFISALNNLLNYDPKEGVISIFFLGFGILGSAISGLLSWLFFAVFIDMIARVFKYPPRLKEFLTLSGFALIPWIFLGPVNLFKTAGFGLEALGVLFNLIIWLWVTVLVFKAVMKTYELTFGRVVILLTIPFLGGFIAFNWFIGFISTLVGALST